MKCPHCNHVFPLTWHRYFTEPGTKHRCPSCQKTSKLPSTVSYWLLLFLAQCVLGVPFALYAFFKFGGYWSLAGYAIGAFLSGSTIDKMVLDEKYRTLQKLDDDTQV